MAPLVGSRVFCSGDDLLRVGRGHISHANNIVRRAIRDDFNIVHACAHELLRHIVADAQLRGHVGSGSGDARVKFLFHRGILLDVDFPAGQPGGQARVLAALADCERELVVVHADFHGLLLILAPQVFQFGGLERLGDELLDVRRPADDVHLLVVQFAHDVLHARTLHADACADRVHLRIR